MSIRTNSQRAPQSDNPTTRDGRVERTISRYLAPVTVAVAASDQYTREGLRSFLARERDIRFVGDAAHGAALAALIATHQPHVAIATGTLPGLVALDTSTRLAPRTRLVIIDHGAARDPHCPVVAGASVLLPPDHTVPELLHAVRSVAPGDLAPPRPLAPAPRRDHAQYRDGAAVALTGRERDLLRLIADGCSNSEIGAHLGIAIKTVDTHRRTLYRKLGAHNASELLMRALHLRLLVP
jgi:DNA-binding NarL/FixJ family response regulator